MAELLTDEQIDELMGIFRIYDKDDDGRVTSKDLGTVLRSYGENHTEAKLQHTINTYDTDQKGYISFPEFLNMATSERKKLTDVEEEQKKTFNDYDRDQDGFISAEELRHLVADFAEEEWTYEEIEELMKEADVDGDGQLNYDEFTTMMLAMLPPCDCVCEL